MCCSHLASAPTAWSQAAITADPVVEICSSSLIRSAVSSRGEGTPLIIGLNPSPHGPTIADSL